MSGRNVPAVVAHHLLRVMSFSQQSGDASPAAVRLVGHRLWWAPVRRYNLYEFAASAKMERNGGLMARHSSHILELARRGAEHRLAELRAEITALIKDFPHLAERAGTAVGTTVGRTEAQVTRTVRRGRTMSAAARKAVSERMKKYWAAKRTGRKK